MDALRNVIKGILSLSLVIFLHACGSKDKFDASGNFEAREIMVSAQANGEIKNFQISEGQEIGAGVVVGYIDSLQLHLQKRLILASLNATNVRRPDVAKQIAVVEESIRKAKEETIRVKNLLRGDAATQKQLDDAQAQVRSLEAQLAAQKNSLDINVNSIAAEASVQEIQLAQVQDQLNKCQIVNPVKGSVLAKYAEVGEQTAIGRPLYKIADVSELILRAYVTENQLSELRLGQKVQVYVQQDKESKTYEGALQWISDKSEFTPKTIQTKDERANLVYAIKIGVKNDGFLKIGMYADVRFK